MKTKHIGDVRYDAKANLQRTSKWKRLISVILMSMFILTGCGDISTADPSPENCFSQESNVSYIESVDSFVTEAQETEAPETEAPETKVPETKAPETEVPETEAPATEAPETEAPETEAPETEAPETKAPETKAPETKAPETEAPETEAPETEVPETEAPATEAPETEAPETEVPETEAPATEAPETEAPETKAPETEAPETKAPETKAPETKAPETEALETEALETNLTVKKAEEIGSSMTYERISELVDVAYFWAPTGNKVHIDPKCRSFGKGVTYAGTYVQAISVRDGGFCGICSKRASADGNFEATADVLEECYTYEDFINGIPAWVY